MVVCNGRLLLEGNPLKPSSTLALIEAVPRQKAVVAIKERLSGDQSALQVQALEDFGLGH